ncbi:MAG: hypothetical protein IJJ16_02665 [Mogibacterium sp.]|nr:hypothetical protein [Mogibacterium sp.]
MANKRNLIAAAGYITWIGFIIAVVMGDRGDGFSAHHLNQALVINLIGVVGGVLAVIPLIGSIASGIISVAVFAYDVMGAISAYKGSTQSLPFLENIHLIG